MTGSLINAALIVLAAVAVAVGLPAPSGRVQRRLQVLLAGLTLGLGFHVMWLGLGGTAGQVLRQVGVVALALMLGRVTGQALGLQETFNRLGQFARTRLVTQPEGGTWPAGEVFRAATVVFCLTPLAFVGPLQEGLRGDPRALLIKGVVDGLATLALARTRGWEVAAVALPVLAFQGTATLLLTGLRVRLEAMGAADVLYVTSGFLLLAVALVMFPILRIRLADYLPSLVWAALLGLWIL